MPGTVTIDLIPTHLRVDRDASLQAVAAQLAVQGMRLVGAGAKAIALPINSDELTRACLIRMAADALERHKVDGRACACPSCNEVRAVAARIAWPDLELLTGIC